MPYRKVIVESTPTVVCPFNPRRTGIIIYNPGPATVYISDKMTNILDEGFPLGTGVYLGFAKVDGDETEYALYAQVASGTQEIRVAESFGEIKGG